jgi:hypothetical protein
VLDQARVAVVGVALVDGLGHKGQGVAGKLIIDVSRPALLDQVLDRRQMMLERAVLRGVLATVDLIGDRRQERDNAAMEALAWSKNRFTSMPSLDSSAAACRNPLSVPHMVPCMAIPPRRPGLDPLPVT